MSSLKQGGKPLPLAQVESLVEVFPYSQLLRLLYVQSLYEKEDLRLEQVANYTAVHTPQREVLEQMLRPQSHLPSKEFGEKKKLELIVEPQQVQAKAASGDLKPKEETFSSESAEGQTLAEIDPILEKQYLSYAVESSISMEVEASDKERLETVEKEQKQEEGPGLTPGVEQTDGEKPGSFLDFISASSSEKSPVKKVPEHQKSTEQILDDFIQGGEKQKRKKVDLFDPEKMAKKSLEDKEGLVSDTLARIYVNQGNYEKAIEAYNKLQLKFPDKSDYFASRIKKVEDLKSKKKK